VRIRTGDRRRIEVETPSDRSLRFATEENYHHGYARRDRGTDYQREVLAFRLGTEEYALDILRIREIIKMRPVTEVPRAPVFVVGIISVRGQVIPVVDLRTRLHVTAIPAEAVRRGKEARILIVTREGDAFGLIVDAVHQVVRMRDEDVEPPPQVLGGADAEFIAGIGRPRADRMLILLALDAVVNFSAAVTHAQRQR
jgi:purine-binding chemotaxis protein CheW